MDKLETGGREKERGGNGKRDIDRGREGDKQGLRHTD